MEIDFSIFRLRFRDTMSKTNRTELLGSQYGSSSQNKSIYAESGGWSSTADDDPILPEDPSALDVQRLKSTQSQMLKGITEFSVEFPLGLLYWSIECPWIKTDYRRQLETQTI